jgi:hypothetical protein
MSKIDESRLLRFLHRPRFLHEVAEHFGISKKLASLHLREAIKSGHVLVSEKPIFQTSGISKAKLKRLGGFLYVLRNSSMIEDSGKKLVMKEPNNLDSRLKYDFSFIRSSKVHGSLGKEVFSRKLSGFAFAEAEGSRNQPIHFKTTGSLTSEFDLPSAKVKMTKQKPTEHLLVHENRSTRTVKSLSSAEKIQLLQTLLKPSTFLDLHGRFGVSKETIKSLIKNGLLAEVWGPKAVGLRFKLTRKGKTSLKELESAARYEPRKSEASRVKLKSRVSI